ncbi:unnamed protein product [Ostreobium quekettii]|uniref:Uncharacterized protein n=1 Tax=Ostreobium quekettii TaxID=121088 RepID=A0A8S1IPQ2_9CHLO|nr:unnamed protein product [Ostreobium quekettii]
MMSTRRITCKRPFTDAFEIESNSAHRSAPVQAMDGHPQNRIKEPIKGKSPRKLPRRRPATQMKISKAAIGWTSCNPFQPQVKGSCLDGSEVRAPQSDVCKHREDKNSSDATALGQDCAAAIQLLSLRFGATTPRDTAHVVSSLDQLFGPVIPEAPAEPKLLTCPDRLVSLPAEKMCELRKMEDELLQARWDVHAAEVAASAVAQILAVRTAAAAQARARYVQSCSRLQGFIAEANGANIL